MDLNYDALSERERAVLRAVFEAGACERDGRAWSCVAPDDTALLRLLGAVAEDWYVHVEAPRCAHCAEELRRMHDEVPGWLLSLPSRR